MEFLQQYNQYIAALRLASLDTPMNSNKAILPLWDASVDIFALTNAYHFIAKVRQTQINSFNCACLSYSGPISLDCPSWGVLAMDVGASSTAGAKSSCGDSYKILGCFLKPYAQMIERDINPAGKPLFQDFSGSDISLAYKYSPPPPTINLINAIYNAIAKHNRLARPPSLVSRKLTPSTFADSLLSSVQYYSNSSETMHSIFFDDLAFLSFSLYSSFILNLKVDSSVTDPVKTMTEVNIAFNTLALYKKPDDIVKDVKRLVRGMGITISGFTKRHQVLEKRGVTSSLSMSTIDLYLGYCSLNKYDEQVDIDKARSTDLLVGCVAGILAYCNQATGNTTAIALCHEYWDVVFDQSLYYQLLPCFGWRLNSGNCYTGSRAYDSLEKRKVVGDFVNIYAFPNTTADRKSVFWI
jgi:hypothetical protein